MPKGKASERKTLTILNTSPNNTTSFYIYICWSNLPYFVFQLCFLFIFFAASYRLLHCCIGLCRFSVQQSFIHSFYLLNPFVHSFFSPVNPLNPPLEMRPIPALGRGTKTSVKGPRLALDSQCRISSGPPEEPKVASSKF